MELNTNHLSEQSAKESNYQTCKDWKFVSVIQFVNLFKNVLGLETCSSIDLELEVPRDRPIMSQSAFKAFDEESAIQVSYNVIRSNSKVYENFEFIKLQEMLLKKINYFYKIYIRQLKRAFPEINNIQDLIKADIDEYNSYKQTRFNLDYDNLSRKIEYELNLETLLIMDFFREFEGRNPLLKNEKSNRLDLNNLNQELNEDEILKTGSKQDSQQSISEDYFTFLELSLEDKIKFLYFFTNYAMSFSGRAPIYKEEITKDNKENPNMEIIKAYKRVKPIGKDKESNLYYSLLCNKDCRLYVENAYTREFGSSAKNYEELEKFMSSIESSKNSNEINLIKVIKDSLLTYKENDEEEKKKELSINLKQQALEKSKKTVDVEKYQKSEYYLLMNTSGHVVTRNQLNQITKTTIPNPSIQNQASNCNSKQQQINDEERKKQKIEKERMERQKRLEKRNKMLERKAQNEFKRELCETLKESANDIPNKILFDRKNYENFKNRKRNRSLKKKNKYDSSEEEFLSEYESENQSDDIELCSDKEEDGEYEVDNNAQKPIINHHDPDYHPEPNRSSSFPESKVINIPSVSFDEPPSTDIVLEGYLIYRYSNDQIELEGNWFISNDQGKERLSYLFLKPNEFIKCEIDHREIEGNEDPNSKSHLLKICSSNLYECIIINKYEIFNSVLNYLTGDYSGYFMYYGKTIEDKVTLNFSLQDSLVRINGDGTNNLGHFSIIGYMNFYRNKEEILEKNDLDCDFIKLSEFRLTKIYTAFNPNENYRVIKSYQHRRKKVDDEI